MKYVYQTIPEQFESFDLNERTMAVQRALENLPEDLKQVIYDHYYDRMHVKEIAKNLIVPKHMYITN